jgi:hypothetical protein
MSYGYSAPYEDYSPIEYAQPHTEPIHVHPESAAAQLGLTQEEIREVLEDQERWFREEYLPELEAETRYRQEQHSNNTQSPPPSTTHPEPEYDTDDGYNVPYEPPQVATSHDDGVSITSGGPIPARYQTPTPTADTQPPPSPVEYDVQSTMNDDDDTRVVSFEHDEFNGDATQAEPDRFAMISLIMVDLVVPGAADWDWAAEMDEEMGLTRQGEYTPANYTPPSLAPWYQPPPPTSDYVPPRTHYRPPYARDRPPRTRYTSQRPPYRPHTRPQRVRYPPRENRTSHVTATRRFSRNNSHPAYRITSIHTPRPP